jgi:hypothetical protein
MRVFIYVFMLLMISCKTSSKSIASKENIKVSYIAELSENFNEETINSSPTKIDSIYYDNKELHLYVSFSGGCEIHEFSLIGHIPVMKSLPPKRNVFLIHNSKSDTCRELIKTELVFNIENMINDFPNSGIILLLDGISIDIPKSK